MTETLHRVLALLFLSCLSHALFSQERTPLARFLTEVSPDVTERSGKCGTPLVFEASRIWPSLSSASRQTLGSILQREERQKNRLSPRGRFRIHYDTTGVHEPALLQGDTARIPGSYEQYVDSVGALLEYCWDQEITVLGFDPPPADNGAGGGDEYDVYIVELGLGTFGSTFWDPEDSLETGVRQRYPTYIVLDRDYLGERTPGLNGLRVTVAHEFHHAVQVGAYGIWRTGPSSGSYLDLYFYELSAVWIEESVFGDVNDYYFDLPRFFNMFEDALGRAKAFNTYGGGYLGYERSVWALYLEKRFGSGTLKQIWESMRTVPAIPAMDAVLRSRGSDLRSAFVEFGTWNLFTAYRARPGEFYHEASSYPPLSLNGTTTVSGSAGTVNGSAAPWSLQYQGFEFPDDTLVAVLAHADVENANSTAFTPYQVSVVPPGSPSPPSSTALQTLMRGGAAHFVSESYERWRTRFVSMVSAVNAGSNSVPAPNPLRLSEAAVLTLPADRSAPGRADVSIFTPSLDLVYRGNHEVTLLLGKGVVIIPVSGFSDRVSSGVHFFHVTTREEEHTWKVLVVR
ncbi:MAG: hypothetical protein HBSIN02_09940 [Bacteroidia bacterium]|nr:MAG: hypothetical protein HBSIN02_09940 [Bacteroidia bacterium]